MNADILPQAIVSGALIGGLYAVMSIGISLTWGALKVINLAHFSFILLGAYLTYQVTTTFGWDPFLSAPIALVAGFAIGALLQVFFERVKVDEFQSLIISFGLFIILQSLTQTVWSADFRRIDSSLNRYESMSFGLFGVSVQVAPLLAFIAAVVIAVGMSLLLTRTYFGKALRATVQDPEMAQAFGVDYRRVAIVLSGLATAISMLAGVFIATFQSLTPNMSFVWFGIVFPVVILGGLGNSTGALFSGIIVGVAAGISSVIWGPLSASLVTFLILIAALLFRPEGLFRSQAAT